MEIKMFEEPNTRILQDSINSFINDLKMKEKTENVEFYLEIHYQATTDEFTAMVIVNENKLEVKNGR